MSRNAYLHFINATMKPLIEDLEKFDLSDPVCDLTAPEVKSIPCVTMLTATYRASNAWVNAAYQREAA